MKRSHPDDAPSDDVNEKSKVYVVTTDERDLFKSFVTHVNSNTPTGADIGGTSANSTLPHPSQSPAVHSSDHNVDIPPGMLPPPPQSGMMFPMSIHHHQGLPLAIPMSMMHQGHHHNHMGGMTMVPSHMMMSKPKSGMEGAGNMVFELRPMRKKNHKCNYEGCSYATDRKDDLVKHFRTHSKEKPYKCTHEGCSYSAAVKSNLEKHIRIHTGVRPYACTYPGCTYTAAQKNHLDNHLQVHLGKKPFSCSFDGCTYSTTQKVNLAAHLTQHGGGYNAFKCVVDGCMYTSKTRGMNMSSLRCLCPPASVIFSLP